MQALYNRHTPYIPTRGVGEDRATQQVNWLRGSYSGAREYWQGIVFVLGWRVTPDKRYYTGKQFMADSGWLVARVKDVVKCFGIEHIFGPVLQVHR